VRPTSRRRFPSRAAQCATGQGGAKECEGRNVETLAGYRRTNG